MIGNPNLTQKKCSVKSYDRAFLHFFLLTSDRLSNDNDHLLNDHLLNDRLPNYNLGPASTKAFPASFPSYFLKLLMKRLARSLAFSSHSAGFS